MSASAVRTGASGLRSLFLHAHPDDESILTAAAMGRAVADGHAVTLVTANRGEAGEVYPVELAPLAADPAALGAHRATELAAAMAVLGVGDHRFLAAPPDTRWVDSGMAGEPAAALGPDAAGRLAVPFAEAEPGEVAAVVAAVVRELRPHVLVTYDEAGGYGHPDHLALRDAAVRAVELAAGPAAGRAGWSVPKVYWTGSPRSRTVAGLRDAAAVVAAGGVPGLVAHPDPDLTPAVPDDWVTAVVDGSGSSARKAAAMAAHATQLAVVRGAARPSPPRPSPPRPSPPRPSPPRPSPPRRSPPTRATGPDRTAARETVRSGAPPVDLWALTNRIAAPVDLLECFRLVHGTPVPEVDGLEHDLFAGLDSFREA